MTATTSHAPAQFEAEYASLIALLRAHGADTWPHSAGTLLAHLQRTAHTLESWGASRALIAAGLCHAAYGTQGYPTPLLGVAKRTLLREEIGDEAEAIVYAYAASDRQLAQPSTWREPALECETRSRPGEIRDRFSGEYWKPSEQLRRQLAELTAANELDVVTQAQLSVAEISAIGALITTVAPQLSQAGWSAVRSAPRLLGVVPVAAAPSGDADLAYGDLGTGGPCVLLWHGGAGPELTWSRQHALCTTLELRIPWRRGFAPSVAAARQDWEADVNDLLRVMPDRAHVVAHSYGGVSALMAAAIAPQRFGSLTLIEPPLWRFIHHDAELQQLAELGRAFANGAPEVRAAFLALAALPIDHPQTARIERLARNFRDPGEAAPRLTGLRAAGLPIAVASGGHTAAIERMCDVLSSELGARRWVLPGAGHAVQRQAEFNAHLLAFVTAAGP